MSADEWTVARRRALDAVVEHLLPPDPERPPGHGAGGLEAGVPQSIVETLTRPPFAASAPLVLAALDELDARAPARHFSDLDARDREAALRRLERDENPYLSHALVLLVQLALEGFLGDPARGGNRDGLGWRRIGLGVDGPRRSLEPVEPGGGR